MLYEKSKYVIVDNLQSLSHQYASFVWDNSRSGVWARETGIADKNDLSKHSDDTSTATFG